MKMLGIVVVILACVVGAYWAGYYDGAFEGHQRATADYEQQRNHVKRGMEKAGICRWFKLAPKYYGCPNIVGKGLEE